LADVFNGLWPDSAAALSLKGHAEVVHEGDFKMAKDCFLRALDGGKQDFWIASWECAEIYRMERKWHTAIGYFNKALESDIAREIFVIHDSIARCFLTVKIFDAAAKHFGSCL